ncbi:MAG: winged helix-turn-helix transcriptional regulator [Gammaproteobacteria bacterium]|nr:winged helix-turn-helix transcriptional regulator [Gammaproteobacteria bacterium]
MIRIFLDAGRRVREGLAALDPGACDGWPQPALRQLRSVLQALRDLAPAGPDAGAVAAVPARPALVETLSEREREVLQAIANGASNQSIAAQLGISDNTVKWHVKNIFGKLAVPNRTAAARAARSLGLID